MSRNRNRSNGRRAEAVARDAQLNTPERGSAVFQVMGATARRSRTNILGIDDVLVREFRGTNAIRTIDRMLMDPVIGGIIERTTLLMRSADWTIEPPQDATPQEIEFADFCTMNFDRVSGGFREVIANSGEMIAFGFALFEVLFERDDNGDIVWSAFAPRDQRTIQHWDVDPDTGIIRAAYQRILDHGLIVPIPSWKLLHFRTQNLPGRPEGRSLLRNSFLPWTDKQELRRIMKVGIRRDFTGLAKFEVPPEITLSDATDEQKAALAAAQKMTQEVERDEREGLVVPHEESEDGKSSGWRFSLVGSPGKRQIDLAQVHLMYNREIAMGLMSEYVLLGHESVGSQALSQVKSDMFQRAISAWLDMDRQHMQRHALPVLQALNPRFFGARVPEIHAGDVDEVALGELADFVQKCASSGAIIPDPALDAALRDAAGLPLARGQEEL